MSCLKQLFETIYTWLSTYYNSKTECEWGTFYFASIIAINVVVVKCQFAIFNIADWSWKREGRNRLKGHAMGRAYAAADCNRLKMMIQKKTSYFHHKITNCWWPKLHLTNNPDTDSNTYFHYYYAMKYMYLWVCNVHCKGRNHIWNPSK